MMLITVLLLTLLILAIVGVGLVSAIGAGAIILFGDVIVCMVFIGWLIKKLIDKKRRN